jgi:hypothetical protein
MAGEYFVLSSGSRGMMLLYPPPNPSLRDLWMGGQRFQKPPREPVVAKIRPGHESGDVLHYFGTASLMSDELYGTLREAGVDNIDGYEAVIRSETGAVEHRGFKAFNILGIVRAADLGETRFRDGSGSRLIDANIDSLAIDPKKAQGLLMFRLAEYVGAVIVHARVKRAVEAKGLPNVRFQEPAEFLSL